MKRRSRVRNAIVRFPFGILSLSTESSHLSHLIIQRLKQIILTVNVEKLSVSNLVMLNVEIAYYVADGPP